MNKYTVLLFNHVVLNSSIYMLLKRIKQICHGWCMSIEWLPNAYTHKHTMHSIDISQKDVSIKTILLQWVLVEIDNRNDLRLSSKLKRIAIFFHMHFEMCDRYILVYKLMLFVCDNDSGIIWIWGVKLDCYTHALLCALFFHCLIYASVLLLPNWEKEITNTLR